MIETLSDCLAEIAFMQVQEAQTSLWMQVCFCFSFSVKYYEFTKPCFSWFVSRIPGNRCSGGEADFTAVSPFRGRGERVRVQPPAVQRLCEAVRAVAVVTTSDTTRRMCRNDCP